MRTPVSHSMIAWCQKPARHNTSPACDGVLVRHTYLAIASAQRPAGLSKAFRANNVVIHDICASEAAMVGMLCLLLAWMQYCSTPQSSKAPASCPASFSSAERQHRCPSSMRGGGSGSALGVLLGPLNRLTFCLGCMVLRRSAVRAVATGHAGICFCSP